MDTTMNNGFGNVEKPEKSADASDVPDGIMNDVQVMPDGILNDIPAMPGERKDEFLVFNSRDELVRLEVNKIVYFEADGNYTNVITVNKLKAQVRMNLSELTRTLMLELGHKSSIFMRIGKSCIVNVNYIYKINVLRQYLILSDYCHFAYQLKLSKEALRAAKEMMLEKYRKSKQS